MKISGDFHLHRSDSGQSAAVKATCFLSRPQLLCFRQGNALWVNCEASVGRLADPQLACEHERRSSVQRLSSGVAQHIRLPPQHASNDGRSPQGDLNLGKLQQSGSRGREGRPSEKPLTISPRPMRTSVMCQLALKSQHVPTGGPGFVVR